MHVEEADTHMELGDFTVVRLERGRVWLREKWETSGICGPMAVPARATELLEEGWMMSGAIYPEGGAGSW